MTKSIPFSVADDLDTALTKVAERALVAREIRTFQEKQAFGWQDMQNAVKQHGGQAWDAAKNYGNQALDAVKGPGMQEFLQNPYTQATAAGAIGGGLLGGLSSFGRDKEDRRPFRSALTGALGGGLLGGMGMLAYKKLPEMLQAAPSTAEANAAETRKRIHDMGYNAGWESSSTPDSAAATPLPVNHPMRPSLPQHIADLEKQVAGSKNSPFRVVNQAWDQPWTSDKGMPSQLLGTYLDHWTHPWVANQLPDGVQHAVMPAAGLMGTHKILKHKQNPFRWENIRRGIDSQVESLTKDVKASPANAQTARNLDALVFMRDHPDEAKRMLNTRQHILRSGQAAPAEGWWLNGLQNRATGQPLTALEGGVTDAALQEAGLAGRSLRGRLSNLSREGYVKAPARAATALAAPWVLPAIADIGLQAQRDMYMPWYDSALAKKYQELKALGAMQ